MSMTLEFEDAAILALTDLFPDTRIYGCNFHWNQYLWRKVQEIGLVTDYKNSEEVRLLMRMCSALAHLPVENVDNGWLVIQAETPNNDEKLTKFYDYFVTQWLEHSSITKEM